MKPYQQFQEFYTQRNWEDFKDQISTASIFNLLAEGWYFKIAIALSIYYNIDIEEVKTWLAPYMKLVALTVDMPSTAKTLQKLKETLHNIDILKAYLRHAYYVNADDPHTIIEIIDEKLSELGLSSPNSITCRKHYKNIVGTTKPDIQTRTLPKKTINKVATHLAGEIKQTENKETIQELQNLYFELTGKEFKDS